MEEMRLSQDNIAFAPVLEHLGIAIANVGELKDAEPPLRKAIKLLETGDDASKSHAMAAMEELAQVLDAQGKHEEAKVLWERSKPFREPTHKNAGQQ